MLLTREVDPRIVLIEADGDVGIGLIVAQADVEARPVALDEALLGKQRLGLGGGDEDVDALDPAAQAGLTPGKVGGDPLANRACLADVEDLPVAVVKEVDTGCVGKLAAALRQPLSPRGVTVVASISHRAKGRLLGARPMQRLQRRT